MKDFAKRIFDILVSFLLIISLLPLFIIVSIAIICEDRGPVFFKQERLGLGGRPFRIWKFRSMIQRADSFVDAAGMPTKDRITRVGKYIRKTSIDELPQLFNILIGNMSIVGPRPALLSHFCRYTTQQRRRLEMRPGITGLAQINGRNTLKWSHRIEYDVQYIDNYSLLMDLKIIFQTVSRVIFAQGVVLDRNPVDVDDLGPPQPGIAPPITLSLKRGRHG